MNSLVNLSLEVIFKNLKNSSIFNFLHLTSFYPLKTIIPVKTSLQGKVSLCLVHSPTYHVHMPSGIFTT